MLPLAGGTVRTGSGGRSVARLSAGTRARRSHVRGAAPRPRTFARCAARAPRRARSSAYVPGARRAPIGTGGRRQPMAAHSRGRETPARLFSISGDRISEGERRFPRILPSHGGDE